MDVFSTAVINQLGQYSLGLQRKLYRIAKFNHAYAPLK
jgi:hypothetical protein